MKNDHLAAMPTTDAESPRIDSHSDLDKLHGVPPSPQRAPRSGRICRTFAAVPRFTGLILALGLGLAAACAGDLDDPGRFVDGGTGGPTPDGGTTADMGPEDDCDRYTDIQAELIVPQCGSSLCHDDTNPSVGLDLVSDDVASRLVDVQSTSMACGGSFVFIDSTTPSNSLLLQIVDAVPPCSQPMPFGSPIGLDEEDTACLEVWILDQLGRSN